MAEYIDREAAIKYLENHKKIGKENNILLSADEDVIIKFLREKCPAADVVEVVHCSQCNKWNKQICEHHGLKTEYYDFCSYGERKGGAE